MTETTFRLRCIARICFKRKVSEDEIEQLEDEFSQAIEEMLYDYYDCETLTIDVSLEGN